MAWEDNAKGLCQRGDQSLASERSLRDGKIADRLRGKRTSFLQSYKGKWAGNVDGDGTSLNMDGHAEVQHFLSHEDYIKVLIRLTLYEERIKFAS